MQPGKFGVLFYDDPLPYAALGATFDGGLVAEYGAAAGETLFCPDVTRDPYERAGLSEDGTAAAALTRAWLSGRRTTVAYTEFDNACIDYRAAREVWLRPFFENFSGYVAPASLNGRPFAESPLYAAFANKKAYADFYDGGSEPPPASEPRDAAHLARRLAEASTVLLKNDGLLPAPDAVYLGTAPADIPGYLRLKRDRFSPRAMFRAARRLSGAAAAVVLLDTDGGLTRAQTELVKFAARHAPTVAALIGVQAVELPFLSEVRALVYAPAADAAAALPDIVAGRVSPGGRLPFTWAERSAYPAAHPKGNRVNFFYESVYNGYRYFGAAGIKPLFPFGAGLGYIAAAYDGLKITVTDDDLLVSFTVSNRSAARGSETAFVYVDGADERAYGLNRRLADFAKITLEAGETRTVGMKISLKSLEIPDEAGDFLPNGKYGLTVENGSGAKLYGTVKLGRKCKPKFTAQYVPSYFITDSGLHILGADAQKVLGLPLYGEPPFAADWQPVRRKYGVPPDDAAFARKARAITRAQYDRM